MKKKETEEKLTGFKNCFYSLNMCLMYLHVRVRPDTVTTFTGRCTLLNIIAKTILLSFLPSFMPTKKTQEISLQNCNETHWQYQSQQN